MKRGHTRGDIFVLIIVVLMFISSCAPIGQADNIYHPNGNLKTETTTTYHPTNSDSYVRTIHYNKNGRKVAARTITYDAGDIIKSNEYIEYYQDGTGTKIIIEYDAGTKISQTSTNHDSNGESTLTQIITYDTDEKEIDTVLISYNDDSTVIKSETITEDSDAEVIDTTDIDDYTEPTGDNPSYKG